MRSSIVAGRRGSFVEEGWEVEWEGNRENGKRRERKLVGHRARNMASSVPWKEYVDSVVEKLKEPLLPTHLANWLFSVILLGCISNSWVDINGDDKCRFNKDASKCDSATKFAMVTFLTSSVFVGMELMWDRLANYHRYVYLGELIVSAIFVLVFFGFFVSLANAWTNTESTVKDLGGHGNPGTSIAMCILSIFSWALLAYLSYKGWKEDDLGGIERLGTYGQYIDPVTSAYHGATAGAGYEESDPPIP